jgi:predicted nucleic-acid-binding protein
MLGLDTNVLVRFLVRDNESQFQRAQRLLRHEVGANRKVLISLLVLLEAEWVLRSRYGLHKTQIMEAIAGLLDATETAFEDEPAIEEALHHWKKSNADFADCLVGAHYRRLGCRATATFDTRALKVPGFVAVG